MYTYESSGGSAFCERSSHDIQGFATIFKKHSLLTSNALLLFLLRVSNSSFSACNFFFWDCLSIAIRRLATLDEILDAPMMYYLLSFILKIMCVVFPICFMSPTTKGV